MLWILVRIFGVGVVLLGVGLWPRRVGQAPHCRRCGFDLTGVAGAGAVLLPGKPRLSKPRQS